MVNVLKGVGNRCAKRSRISEAKFKEFVRCFFSGFRRSLEALLTGLNRNTVNRYLRL